MRNPSLAGATEADWDALRTAPRAIRIPGIAAPLLNAEGEVLGSLGIAAQAHKVPAKQHGALATIVAGAAKEACARIGKQQSDSARPARAV